MSEERTSLISSENLPTVAAVSFVLSLLGVVLGIWSLKNVHGVAEVVVAQHSAIEAANKTSKAQADRIDALEKKMADMDAHMAAMPAMPAMPATEAAPASAPK